MKAKTLLLSLTLSFAIVGSAVAQAPTTAPDGYDRTSFDEPGQLAGTSLVQDLDEIKKRAIENIINRIRKGDPDVLKYVVYDVFVEVHKALLAESRERTTKQGTTSNSIPVSYYDVIGGKAALPSFYGCFDNQDPKVRLRCIGYLADWIDDMGISITDIGRQATDRLNSGIETRVEVHYGLVLLQLKVLRKITLNKIWNGDQEILKTISPEEFVVLVHNEPFIREMFCIPDDVRLRSVRLLQWWLNYYTENGGIYWYRTDIEEQTEKRFTDQYTPFRNLAKELGYVEKVNSPWLIYRNYGGHPGKLLTNVADRTRDGYGYQDVAKYQDIASLYDLRYFRYSNDEQLGGKGAFTNEELYLPAIFSGLQNTSLFVRENVARLLVRLSDGPVGFGTGTNTPDYGAIRISAGGVAGFTPWDDVNATSRGNRKATPFELLNDRNEVVGVQGLMNRMAKNSSYQTILRNAWRDVKYAQFMDVHETSRGTGPEVGAFATITNGVYDPNDGIQLERNVRFSATHNSWGYKYNFRTDIADLMRRFNLGRELDFCDREPPKRDDTRSSAGNYFVEDLFDLDTQSSFAYTGSNVKIPLWHGKDDIKDEVFEP